MKKSEALRLLDGTAAAARAIGISTSAISQWPEDLTPAIVDRVQAALARKLLPPEALGIVSSPPRRTPDVAEAAAGEGV